MTERSILLDSPLDSARFGFHVARATLTAVDDKLLIQEIIGKRLDVAILRVPTAISAQIHRLSRVGLHPIHADTLVYYSLSLQNHAPCTLRNADLLFSEATAGDAVELFDLIQGTFENYSSHYHANPFFPPQAILDGYQEWAAGHIAATDGRNVFVARRGGRIIAFACCRADALTLECVGVLYGVHPGHSGGGLYGDLIRYTQARFKERGFKIMKVSTQVGNFAVQKVWARAGFVLSQAYDTFHVNAMLRHGSAAVDRALRFSVEDVERFAQVSGDRNDVHLSDEAARRAGFEQRISHGMLAGSEFSKIFGMQIPGPGTLFLRSELVFLRPIYPDRSYRLQVRFPTGSPGAGYAQAVGTIEDADGGLCLLSYNDLLKRN